MNETIKYLNDALDYIEKTKRPLVDKSRNMHDAELEDIITRFAEVRDLHARLKGISVGINQLAEFLSYELVPFAMERAGFSMVNHKAGRVTVNTRTTATLVDKENAVAWLKANGKADLIIEKVDASTLSATAREMIEAGDELPPEYFKTTIKTYTSLTKPGEHDL